MNNSDTSHYENVPFEVPVGWVWCRLEDIAYVAAGSTPSKESFVENGVPYIKMYNLRNQKIDFEFHPQYITEEVHNNKLARSRTQPGDLLMNIVGPPLGKLAIIPESLPEANFNQAAVLIRPFKFKPAITQYLFYYLSELSEINSISTKGSAGQVNISLTQSQQMRIALPPLAELERITQKIESLFSKIGVLETSIDNIYDHISKIKSGILEKALSGKLVSQDKTEEPAITLLKSINPDFEPTDNRHYANVPYKVPQKWQWVTLSDISNYGECINVPVSNIPENSWILELKDIEKDSGRLIQRMNRSKKNINGVRHSFKKGDVLYSKLRTYLNKVLVADQDGYCTTEIIPITCVPGIVPEYLCHVLRSRYYVDYTISLGYGVKMPRLGTADALKSMIPVPPYEEQRRIVKSVNEIYHKLEQISSEL